MVRLMLVKTAEEVLAHLEKSDTGQVRRGGVGVPRKERYRSQPWHSDNRISPLPLETVGSDRLRRFVLCFGWNSGRSEAARATVLLVW
jgi:hypothetical protein